MENGGSCGNKWWCDVEAKRATWNHQHLHAKQIQVVWLGNTAIGLTEGCNSSRMSKMLGLDSRLENYMLTDNPHLESI